MRILTSYGESLRMGLEAILCTNPLLNSFPCRVAPRARLWAAKVLNSAGGGYSSGIIAGIDWVAARDDVDVANMSLAGQGYIEAEYQAIQGAVENGVAFAVSAGNYDDEVVVFRTFSSKISPQHSTLLPMNQAL